VRGGELYLHGLHDRGATRLEVSPSGSPSATFLSSRLMIFRRGLGQLRKDDLGRSGEFPDLLGDGLT
jgi:hypothetical protein